MVSSVMFNEAARFKKNVDHFFFLLRIEITVLWQDYFPQIENVCSANGFCQKKKKIHSFLNLKYFYFGTNSVQALG